MAGRSENLLLIASILHITLWHFEIFTPRVPFCSIICAQLHIAGERLWSRSLTNNMTGPWTQIAGVLHVLDLWTQTAGVLHVLDHLDSSYLHMEATLNLSFCVAVRVARTISQCSLPLVHVFAIFTVNSDAGPSLICSGPSLDAHTGQCREQEVSWGLGCFHWALADFSREISICHFASHPCGLTNYPLHLHPSPDFTLLSRDSQHPNLFGVLLA